MSEHNYQRPKFEISWEECDRIAAASLRNAIFCFNEEISRPQCHPEDAEECEKLIAAAKVLLEYFGDYG